MDLNDIGMSQKLTLTGEVRGATLIGDNSQMLPAGTVDVTLRVVLAEQK